MSGEACISSRLMRIWSLTLRGAVLRPSQGATDIIAATNMRRMAETGINLPGQLHPRIASHQSRPTATPNL